MIKGIGVDTTDINEINRLLILRDDAFINHTFTKKEVEESKKVFNQSEYLATRFAAKEAVYKAFAHLTKSKIFDFRIVETLNKEDGSPFVNINSELELILTEVGVNNILISITTECNFATAFVIVQ